MGVSTYVIGFGSVAQSNPAALTEWAAAGGTTNFYPAESPQALSQALGTISGQVTLASCAITPDRRPTELDELSVVIDGDVIPRDPVHGWQYDPATNTITFYGNACTRIRSESVQSVRLDYGCTVIE
jgi:hypothetical protein